MTTFLWLLATISQDPTVTTVQQPDPIPSPTSNPLDLLLYYGLPGIVIVLLAIGVFWPRHAVHARDADHAASLERLEHAHAASLVRIREDHRAQIDQLLERSRRAEEQRDQLVDAYEQRVVPVMTQFISTVDRFGAMLEAAAPPPGTAPRRGWPPQ